MEDTATGNQPDLFDVARISARSSALDLIGTVPPAIIADAFISQGLAAWAADTGRTDDAARLLIAWVAIRDAA
jgi:hypothetical protein